jgi:TatD DNase family protein
MRLVDTHCHLNFDSYDTDRDDVIQRAFDAGVTRIIIPAVDIPSIYTSLELAKRNNSISIAVGVHPNSTANFTDGYLVELEKLATEREVVAIGEIGLDYYWEKSPVEMQKRAFCAQLELATALSLPVIIHNRDASEDVMTMLEIWAASGLPGGIKERPGVLHSFSASLEIAQRALNSGFCLGFTGPLTFKKANELRAIARSVPDDRLLLETDGPFLTPEPFRGKRNEPAYVQYIADRLAGLKGYSTQTMAEITTQNAERLFSI